MQLPTPPRASICGLVAGAVAFTLAELLVPADFEGSGHHDVLLAKRLGFAFALLIGGWTAWVQRSRRQLVIGSITALVVGAAYSAVADTRNFFLIMNAFPCLLGGVMAVALRSQSSRALSGAPARLIKGLIAGAALGLVYSFVLQGLGGLLVPRSWLRMDNAEYVALMWKSGLPALALGGAAFFPLFRWAVGSTEIVIVDREAERWREPT